jgi:hypothetical protein
LPVKCPYCDYIAENSHDEIAHMEQKHPDVIAQRLSEAGIRNEDYRQGPDLPSYLTLSELQLVLTFATKYGADELGFMDEGTLIGIHVRDRGLVSPAPSAWVEFSVGARQFAIWRHNGDLYEVNPDGTVGEDPLHKND